MKRNLNKLLKENNKIIFLTLKPKTVTTAPNTNIVIG